MKRATFIVLIMTLFIASDALSCSFASGFTPAQPRVSWGTAQRDKPQVPAVKLSSLVRGHYAEDPGSCADAGSIELEVSTDTDSTYKIELTANSEYSKLFPNYLIHPIELDDNRRGFRFVWLDLPRGQRQLDPLEVTLYISIVDEQGAKSDPKILHLSDPGGFR